MAPINVEKRLKTLTTWLIGVTVFTLAAATLVILNWPKTDDNDDIPEKIYKNMTLNTENLRTLFTPMNENQDPNDIKQVIYGWYENRPNEYALYAYGADSKDVQVSRSVRLTIPDENEYETNWNWMREKDMKNSRGQMKHLLGSERIGDDVVIEDERLNTTIRFTPMMRAYEGTSHTMYFEMNASSTGRQVNANPAPPFSVVNNQWDSR